MSRSATIVLAYLLRHSGWRLLECLRHVRERRPIVAPNHAFMTQVGVEQ
jgi:protein-tyrosine phosphatase